MAVNKVSSLVLANCLWVRRVAVCKDKICNLLYDRDLGRKSLSIEAKNTLKKNLFFSTS